MEERVKKMTTKKKIMTRNKTGKDEVENLEGDNEGGTDYLVEEKENRMVQKG